MILTKIKKHELDNLRLMLLAYQKELPDDLSLGYSVCVKNNEICLKHLTFVTRWISAELYEKKVMKNNADGIFCLEIHEDSINDEKYWKMVMELDILDYAQIYLDVI